MALLDRFHHLIQSKALSVPYVQHFIAVVSFFHAHFLHTQGNSMFPASLSANSSRRLKLARTKTVRHLTALRKARRVFSALKSPLKYRRKKAARLVYLTSFSLFASACLWLVYNEGWASKYFASGGIVILRSPANTVNKNIN